RPLDRASPCCPPLPGCPPPPRCARLPDCPRPPACPPPPDCPPLPERPPPPPRSREPRRRSRRSTLGRGAVGTTRARTRASDRRRPKRPLLGSSRISNSASCSSTPSWSRAASLASSTVLPVTSTHCTVISLCAV